MCKEYNDRADRPLRVELQYLVHAPNPIFPSSDECVITAETWFPGDSV